MKFALYQPWIYLHGGLERSILELVKSSRHEWVIYTGYYDPKGTFPEFAELDVRVVGQTTVKRSMSGVLKSALNVIQLKLPLDRDVDGLVVWCDGIGDLLTFRNNDLPLFNICSTPLRAAFDPVYEATATKGVGLRKKVLYACFKHIFRYVDRLAWKKFEGVVTTSTEVRNRIFAGGLADERQKQVMAHPGIKWYPEVSNQAYEPLILVPGRIMWTKNIQQAIRSFLRNPPPLPWKMIVAGYVDEKSKSYLVELKELAQASNQIEFLVSPTDAELSDLYRRASFCLFTPLNEDWGIAPLESMAYGKAVIANAQGGPLESIVHCQTGYLLNQDDNTWNEAILRLTSEPQTVRNLGRQAHEHVKKFTWEKFTDIVDDSLELWTKMTPLNASSVSKVRPVAAPMEQN